MLIIKEGDVAPSAGTVIKCENGHDAILIGDIDPNSAGASWPGASFVKDGTSIEGMMFPILCPDCQAVAIDVERH